MLVSTALAFGRIARPRFEVAYVDLHHTQMSGPLNECWDAPFEDALPVRSFPSFKGQRNFPGWWWSATSGRHVGHESWLERDHAMLLDFDPEIVGFSSQPFRLAWLQEAKRREHVPDYFARQADGTGVVIDVRAADERIEAEDAEAFAATEAACAEVGWSFRRVGALDPVLAGNVRWLSRYRHPRCGRRVDVAARLREIFREPTPLFAGAAEAGERLGVLPVLFHLLWRQDLTADLKVAVLSSSTLVTVNERAG
ncbi:TnsA-like heteromeric transposase endonuclease subunit [[Actinomadura] parvosata]|uniref:TnsA-like heteromeric transposase endonuclease subunit n=1 Tax=[Actinomadura] parvosata TaxID=1955412 RepID=UPI00406CBA51